MMVEKQLLSSLASSPQAFRCSIPRFCFSTSDSTTSSDPSAIIVSHLSYRGISHAPRPGTQNAKAKSSASMFVHSSHTPCSSTITSIHRMLKGCVDMPSFVFKRPVICFKKCVDVLVFRKCPSGNKFSFDQSHTSLHDRVTIDIRKVKRWSRAGAILIARHRATLSGRVSRLWTGEKPRARQSVLM